MTSAQRTLALRSAMDRRFRVKLDVPRIVDHLAREEGRAFTQDEVFAWLRDAGFARDQGDWWIVSEADLGHLDPSEVLEIEPLDPSESE
jgi:hypothetical protein